MIAVLPLSLSLLVSLLAVGIWGALLSRVACWLASLALLRLALIGWPRLLGLSGCTRSGFAARSTRLLISGLSVLLAGLTIGLTVLLCIRMHRAVELLLSLLQPLSGVGQIVRKLARYRVVGVVRLGLLGRSGLIRSTAQRVRSLTPRLRCLP